MSKKNEIENQIKAFAMSNSMMIENLAQIQDQYNISLGISREEKQEIKDVYYPQFSARVRSEAITMSAHYELFYCLEKTIREIISQSLETAENNEDWWNFKRIPANLKNDVKDRIQKEIDSGITRRSTDELDYTTFGELSQIITSNWDIFGSIFTSKKAVEKVMASLNTLRGPIAHCSLLAEDETVRLNLAVKDWFRLME